MSRIIFDALRLAVRLAPPAALGLSLLSICSLPSTAIAEVAYPSIEAYQARTYAQLGAQCLAQKGLEPECARLLETALRFDPKNAELHHVLGWVYLHQGEHARALVALSEALRLDPRLVDSLRAMGALYCAQGRYALAEEKYQRYLEAVPDDPMGPYGLAAVAALRGHEEACLSYLEKAIALGFSNMALLKADDRFASMRKHPKFVALLGPAGESGPPSPEP
jgi:tetratricopeptide (TPR) repeat protein